MHLLHSVGPARYLHHRISVHKLRFPPARDHNYRFLPMSPCFTHGRTCAGLAGIHHHSDKYFFYMPARGPPLAIAHSPALAIETSWTIRVGSSVTPGAPLGLSRCAGWMGFGELSRTTENSDENEEDSRRYNTTDIDKVASP